MSKKIINKVVDETVDTIIDKIYELTEEYMWEYGNYTESNDKFTKDHSAYMEEVIKELNNRINNQ